ncbi:AraC-like DNA-binding protein [Streptosporangium becharense]|uniref:AraC-like DNA-binding protein n=1 Tax=Streptosporangium becharense TaxID=1816182 RepID=A0A7W9MFL2_9ACTN|nr:helix-turn-helix transcriptional regulator [Streptosporangium becharense]MBB2910125.1 AraC-like DNA-binding protein [Streptosporangium becharense]MBB5818920.1 AraC-like DNA-binding protein [Streptosporangium becharense]
MYREWAPDPPLNARVACVWVNEAVSSATEPVVPDGCVDLIWGPYGPHVAGPDTGPQPVPMVPGDRYIGIRFRPGGVGEVFGVPVESLRDLRVPLSDLDGVPELAPLTRLPERTDATEPSESVAAEMQRALAARLRVTSAADPSAAAVVASLRAGRNVAEVARDLGIGERQLRRRSLRAFGYGPKTLQRVVRFQLALRLARRGVAAAEVALASGYADQAHMANEVRRLAGVPLGRLVGRPDDEIS